jgi:hypothetical protein
METRPFLADTTVFVTTIGDEVNFEDCLAHLDRQTTRFVLEIIDRVAPMSAALQEMLERCRTPYYVQVDEDMILSPEAIQQLEYSIRDAPANTALVCAPLWDCDCERPIHGVKIYRHAIAKQFPYRDELSTEKGQLARIEAAGYSIVRQPLNSGSTCLGEHGKHYTPETIFIRWQRCFQKHLQGGYMSWIEDYPPRLLDRYFKSRDPLHLYAFLGAAAGITDNAVPDRELDWRVPNRALERIQIYFPAHTRRGQAGDGSQGSPGLSTEAVQSSVEEQACQQQRAVGQEPDRQIRDADEKCDPRGEGGSNVADVNAAHGIPSRLAD